MQSALLGYPNPSHFGTNRRTFLLKTIINRFLNAKTFLRFKSFHFQLKREHILSDIPGSPESQRLFGAKEEQRRCGRLFFNEKVGASKACSDVVGMTGFEPAALCSQSRCATKLRYIPIVLNYILYAAGSLRPSRLLRHSAVTKIVLQF